MKAPAAFVSILTFGLMGGCHLWSESDDSSEDTKTVEEGTFLALKPHKKTTKSLLQAKLSLVSGDEKQSGLRMPSPKRCLAGPSLTGTGDESEMAASQGLSVEQASIALNTHVPRVSSCIENAWPEGTIDYELNVGCDGVVQSVTLLDAGGFEETFTECVSEVLSYAEFPAHALPDGDTIEYPLTFSQ